MRSHWLLGILVTIALLVVLALTGRKSVHAERVIPHTAEAIWAVLLATERYNEWNPVLVAAEGNFEAGSTMRYQMRTGDGGTTPVDSLVTRLDDEREINQFGGMRGVLTFDHTWILEPAAGGTRVTQHEEYRGIGVWFWNPAWVEAAYSDALVALERHLAE